MPRRKPRTRARRLADKNLGPLRDWIRSGAPWRRYGFSTIAGGAEVHGLIDGCFFDFALHYMASQNDMDTAREIWDLLKDDILPQHIRHAPGSRPRGWWLFEPEAAEARRVVDVVDDDGEVCGETDETERAYLERNGLLTPWEQEIFAKFGDVVRVRRAPAHSIANCGPCWQDAKEIAEDLGFDLDAAMDSAEKFWVPAVLYLVCDHEPRYHGNDSIFQEV
jgi:hypothetical protein